MMVETVGASPGGDEGIEAVEAMLAEGLGDLLALGDIDLPSGMAREEHAWRREMAGIRAVSAAAEDSLRPFAGIAEYQHENEIAWPAEVGAIDALLRETARALAWRDLELARLAHRCLEHGVWRELHYASFDQYCREWVGLSPSSIGTRVALARRIEALPRIEDAVAAGAIGYEAAALIARVAGPATADAWVERAGARTVKLLREEVDAVELRARADGTNVQEAPPPDEAELAEVHALEREVIAQVSGEARGEGQMSGGEGEATATTTLLRLSLSEDAGRFWRCLERLHAQHKIAGSFVAFLVRAVMKAWSGTITMKDAYADVYARDRWRCASPVCRSRNVTPHHVVFRSRGGGEERSNLVSLCKRCHLDLVHGSRLTVTGQAGALRWQAAGWRVWGRESLRHAPPLSEIPQAFSLL